MIFGVRDVREHTTGVHGTFCPRRRGSDFITVVELSPRGVNDDNVITVLIYATDVIETRVRVKRRITRSTLAVVRCLPYYVSMINHRVRKRFSGDLGVVNVSLLVCVLLL